MTRTVLKKVRESGLKLAGSRSCTPGWAAWARRVGKLCLVSLIIIHATESEAHAYTDPGSGAMIWQMLVAGLIGAGFYFRKLLFWFKEKKNGKKKD